MISKAEGEQILSRDLGRIEETIARYSARPVGCIGWTGAHTLGYPVISLKTSVGWRAIRVSRILLALEGRLDISNPQQLACHHCDNALCINTGHMFVGSQKDNMQDASNKGRVKVPGLSGVNHPQAKLSAGQVREIRKSPETSPKLAGRFGVSKFAILQIKNNKQYVSVPA